MRGRKKVKRGIILLLLFLTAGLFFQPLQASETQCGIWCPSCAKWQEQFRGSVPDSLNGQGRKAITVSCAECGKKLLEAIKWEDALVYNLGTSEESNSWWAQYTMKRCSSDVVFPNAEAYSEGGTNLESTYRVVADGNVFGATGYGWTTQAIYDTTVYYLSSLFNSLYHCADGEFSWEDWYNYGLSVNASGVKSSPLISYMSKFGIKAVLQEEMTPSVLTIIGDADVQIYREGVLVENALTDGGLQTGDVVQITPVKIAGSEYADYTISENAKNVSWQADTQLMSFTMPAGEVKVELSYWELQRLVVELSPSFYETYQKEPYWDGEDFNLDCEPPITVENEMLVVKAILQHSGTLDVQEREVTGFTIVGGNEIVNLGENTITVSADVFGDGYALEGNCVIRADSAALEKVMQQTQSETYTELKMFVESLIDNLSGYEQVIEELSKDLEISEVQRADSERKLAEALAEVISLTEKLEEKKEQIGKMSSELGSLSEELATMTAQLEDMKETLTTMQGFLQQITGEEKIDKDLLEKAKKEFDELKNQKEGLMTELEKLTEENQNLTEENQNLEERNESLAEKNENLAERNESLTEKNESLFDKLEKLSEENEILQNELERVMTDNTGLAEQNAILVEKNTALGEQIAALLQKNTELVEKNGASDAEKQEWQKKYELLLAERSLEKSETEKEETYRTEVHLTEVETSEATLPIPEQELESEETEKLETEMATKLEQELGTERSTLAELMTEETMTSAEPLTTEESTTVVTLTEKNQKEEADYQSAGIGSGRKLLPGIVVVVAAMLLGGVVLYVSLEQKELPFKIENLKNLG